LLAAIVELATGEKFEEYLRRTLLLPLGMYDTRYAVSSSDRGRLAAGRVGSNDWYRPGDPAAEPSWNLVGNGSLFKTISDLVRWRKVFGAPLWPGLEDREIIDADARDQRAPQRTQASVTDAHIVDISTRGRLGRGYDRSAGWCERPGRHSRTLAGRRNGSRRGEGSRRGGEVVSDHDHRRQFMFTPDVDKREHTYALDAGAKP